MASDREPQEMTFEFTSPEGLLTTDMMRSIVMDTMTPEDRSKFINNLRNSKRFRKARKKHMKEALLNFLEDTERRWNPAEIAAGTVGLMGRVVSQMASDDQPGVEVAEAEEVTDEGIFNDGIDIEEIRQLLGHDDQADTTMLAQQGRFGESGYEDDDTEPLWSEAKVLAFKEERDTPSS